MFPEAGGSSSFARHAFNEVASFFAGWALTLDYIITIAISAFFVPHYLGAFFPALSHNPGDIIGGAVDRAAGGAEHPRPARVGVAEHRARGADLATQVLLVGLGVVAGLQPVAAGRPGPPRGRAELDRELIFALSVAMVAYTGIETVSNMAEEARDPGHDVPRRRSTRAVRGARRLRRHLGRRAVALPVTQDAHGHYSTLLGTKYRERPGARHRRRPRAARTVVTTALRYYVGVLAATILLIATNAGLIGISRLSWSLAEHRQLPERVRAPAPALPHALVHDRLLLGRSRRC